ncbi:MAG: protein translocase subunit SecF [Coriobacteriales bacterium]|jgi:SecD/SecF fusion protein|nr:protein translocase subunit SecF [Coriobacteriales bacterium]
MARLLKREINFLKYRKAFFIIAATLILIALVALPVRGLNFGIEFVGGSSVDFKDTGAITEEQMRDAFVSAGSEAPIVQSTTSTQDGTRGFIVRIAETDPQVTNEIKAQVAAAFGLDIASIEVNIVGPGWGQQVTRTSAIAFIVAIALIIIYIAIRFEYKMGVTAVLTLIHDLVIILGVYAILGREVTPNVVAALLTIMGYSLYDTVVVFHRINDNLATTANHSFMTVANHSVNQVFTRTINTTLTSLIPVLAMLFFGGETLRDFAFAMAIGLVLGSYSSIALASPFYAIWKQREPKYKKLAGKYGEGLDEFTVAEQLGS